MGKKIITFFICVSMMLSLVACGGDAVQGTWKLSKGYVGEIEVKQEQLQKAGVGGTCFTFKDGKVEISMDSSAEISEGTYTLEGNNLTITSEGEEDSFSGTVEGELLTITYEEEGQVLKLEFEKQ